jgi:hypothetical protein
MAESIFEQKGTKIGHRAALFLRTFQQFLVHVETEGDRDAAGLTLQDA